MLATPRGPAFSPFAGALTFFNDPAVPPTFLDSPMAPDPVAPAATNELRLKDLRATEDGVTLIARVVSATRREIRRKSDGGRRTLLSGLLSDGTASVRFTWWDPPPEGVDRGTVLRVANAKVREFRGRLEVTFDWRSRVEEGSPLELPSVTASELPRQSLASLKPRDEGFSLEARVVRVGEKNVTVGDERRVVHEGVLGDGSGTIAFSSWTDFRLRTGEALRIAGGYVGSFRGRAQLVLDERAQVERIPGSALPSAVEFSNSPPRSLAEVEASGGGVDVCVEGVVVGLSPPSGLVYRCPTCRRLTQQGLCRLHGRVEGEPDLRARLVIDDGTGSATVQAGRADAESLGGFTLEEWLQKLRSQPDASRIEETLFERTFGERLRVRGDASRDDFGVSLYPSKIERIEPTPLGSVAILERRLAELLP
jgi:replication factor A1